MAGIIGIYGLVVSVLISDGLKQEMALYTGFIQLGAGLSVGLAGLAAGYANFINILCDAGRTMAQIADNISIALQSASWETQAFAAQLNSPVYSSA